MKPDWDLSRCDTPQEIAELLRILANSFGDDAVDALGQGNIKESRYLEKVSNTLNNAADKLDKIIPVIG